MAPDPRAAKFLLLVGSIVQFVGGIVFLFVIWQQQLIYVFGTMGYVFVATAVLSIAGGPVGLAAFQAAREGNLDRAFKLGIVAACLPPVQILPLLCAIYCKGSPKFLSNSSQPRGCVPRPHAISAIGGGAWLPG